MTSTTDIGYGYLTRQAMFTGYQYASLFTPLVYAFFTVTRRGRGGLTINNVLRATWIGGTAGSMCVGGLAYARYAQGSAESVRAKKMAIAYDAKRIQANDYATIGAALSAVLFPAILWKRAYVVNLILGGAGVGSAIGLVTHHYHTLVGGRGPTLRTST